MNKWLLSLALAASFSANAASVLGDKIRAETVRHSDVMNAIATEVDNVPTVCPPTEPPVPPGTGEGGSPGFKYDRSKTLQPPVYGALPAKGEKRLHAPTGAEVKRVTGDGGRLIVYSRYSPTSVDNKYLLAFGENSNSVYVVDRATGNTVRSLTVGEDQEVRWHGGTDAPSRLYYHKGAKFYRYDVVSGVETLIRDFALDFPGQGSVEITTKAEGDSSNDSRYWVWMVRKVVQIGSYPVIAIFRYDLVSNTITGKMLPTAAQTDGIPRPNMVESSPSGKYAIIHWGESFGGPQAWNTTLTAKVRNIGVDETHSGWAVGTDGSEWYVSQNNNIDTIEAVNLETGTTKVLLQHADIAYTNFHIGKSYNLKDVVLVSTYDSRNTNWGLNQLFVLSLTGKAPLRVASTFNVWPGNEGYRNESSAAWSHDGNGIYWTSNWGLGTRARDAYEIRLPIGWSTK